MRKQFLFFILRWLLVSFGLWISSRVLVGDFRGASVSIYTFLLAGLVLSLVNVVLKPIIVILSLPAILLTLGLFMLVVNGLMVYIALKFVPDLKVSFWGAILTGMIISLINYIITSIMDYNKDSNLREGN